MCVCVVIFGNSAADINIVQHVVRSPQARATYRFTCLPDPVWSTRSSHQMHDPLSCPTGSLPFSYHFGHQ